jgi:hypothetical protein
MILPQFGAPLGKLESKLFQDLLPAIQFDGMSLSIVEADGLDVLVAFKRPREARGGILSTREKYKCFEVHVPLAGETGLLYVCHRHKEFGDEGWGNDFRPLCILAGGVAARFCAAGTGSVHYSAAKTRPRGDPAHA